MRTTRRYGYVNPFRRERRVLVQPPSPPPPQIVQIGDWCTLIHGDSREVLPTLDASCSIVSDPPFGIDFYKEPTGSVPTGRQSGRRFSERIYGDDEPFDPALLLRFQSVAVMGADHFASRLPPGGSWHVWDRTGGGRGPRDSFSDATFIWSSHPGRSRIVHHLFKGVCQDENDGKKKLHPFQKPVRVMMWMIEMFASDAEIIVDPYLGSGTAAIAALRLNKRFVGIEVDRTVFNVAVARIEKDMFALDK